MEIGKGTNDSSRNPERSYEVEKNLSSFPQSTKGTPRAHHDPKGCSREGTMQTWGGYEPSVRLHLSLGSHQRKSP